MNYRNYYEFETGNVIADNYQVHHLDHNRNNNKIENLVSIPIDLHRRYHASYCKFINAIEIINNQWGFSNKKQQDRCTDSIIKYMSCKDEILSYMFIRNTLLYK